MGMEENPFKLPDAKPRTGVALGIVPGCGALGLIGGYLYHRSTARPYVIATWDEPLIGFLVGIVVGCLLWKFTRMARANLSERSDGIHDRREPN
jgi:hypothetical protein